MTSGVERHAHDFNAERFEKDLPLGGRYKSGDDQRAPVARRGGDARLGGRDAARVRL